MMIQIDTMEMLLRRLKSNGWKQNGGYAIKGRPRVLEGFGKKIVVVKPIKIDPYKVLQDEINKFFKALEGIILRNGVKDVFLPVGGTIPIPQFFLDFCREKGINIHLITPENVDQYENWEQ